MTNRTGIRHSPLTRFRWRIPGMITDPTPDCPLPLPPEERGQLVLTLPSTEQSEIRRAVRRLLATQEVWLHDARWTLVRHAPARLFTRHVALVYDEATPIWDLCLVDWSGLHPLDSPHASRLSDIVSRRDLDTWDTQPPDTLYGGCQSIIIRRTHLERLCMFTQRTLFGRLLKGYRTLFDRRSRLGREATREAAQTQLDALVTIHDHLPAANITHTPPMHHPISPAVP